MKNRGKKIMVSICLILIAVICCVLLSGKAVDVRTDKTVEGLSEEMQDILFLASLAPSSHNIQSWKAEVYPEKEMIEIKTDRVRSLPQVDPLNRETAISLGCYVETLELAFKAYGYETKVSIDDPQVNVHYNKTGDETDNALINLIKTRHSDKAVFESNEVIPIILKGYAQKSTGLSFYSFESSEGEAIRELTLNAYIDEAKDQKQAAELSDWLRLSDTEAVKKKDGLPAEQLGIFGIKKVMYYAFTDHENAKGGVFVKQGIEQAKAQLGSGTGFIVISAPNDFTSLINAGRETVKCWIKLTECRISVHPMSYALELPEYREKLVSALGTDEEPQMLLRTGITDEYGKNALIRRDLGDYITVHK
ncbi:MAG: hypothetical protein K6A90_07445 [Lachnospiraceae bacterium]|nr:hypothetical protein [Lachnospiraceae bacterium]